MGRSHRGVNIPFVLLAVIVIFVKVNFGALCKIKIIKPLLTLLQLKELQIKNEKSTYSEKRVFFLNTTMSP